MRLRRMLAVLGALLALAVAGPLGTNLTDHDPFHNPASIEWQSASHKI